MKTAALLSSLLLLGGLTGCQLPRMTVARIMLDGDEVEQCDRAAAAGVELARGEELATVLEDVLQAVPPRRLGGVAVSVWEGDGRSGVTLLDVRRAGAAGGWVTTWDDGAEVGEHEVQAAPEHVDADGRALPAAGRLDVHPDVASREEARAAHRDLLRQLAVAGDDAADGLLLRPLEAGTRLLHFRRRFPLADGRTCEVQVELVQDEPPPPDPAPVF